MLPAWTTLWAARFREPRMQSLHIRAYCTAPASCRGLWAEVSASSAIKNLCLILSAGSSVTHISITLRTAIHSHPHFSLPLCLSTFHRGHSEMISPPVLVPTEPLWTTLGCSPPLLNLLVSWPLPWPTSLDSKTSCLNGTFSWPLDLSLCPPSHPQLWMNSSVCRGSWYNSKFMLEPHPNSQPRTSARPSGLIVPFPPWTALSSGPCLSTQNLWTWPNWPKESLQMWSN